MILSIHFRLVGCLNTIPIPIQSFKKYFILSGLIGNPSSSLTVLSSPKSNAARVSTDLQMSWESAWSIIHFVRSKLSSPSSSQLFHFSFFSAAGNHTLHKARGREELTNTQMRFRSQPLVALQCVVTGPPLKTAFIMFPKRPTCMQTMEKRKMLWKKDHG